MRRRGWNDQYGGGYPRRRGGWFIGSPFGIGGGFGGGYGPRYRRGYGGGMGGGGCMRDACLLESGCCLAESLDGSCLLLTVLALPQLLVALVRPACYRGGVRGAALTVIDLYQRNVSARRSRPVCRLTPSCSSYAAEAIARHGLPRGLRLAVRRLLRCRPGGRRGGDPVPG